MMYRNFDVKRNDVKLHMRDFKREPNIAKNCYVIILAG